MCALPIMYLFLTVWVSGAKKGWCVILSLPQLRCKCIYYAASWNLFVTKSYVTFFFHWVLLFPGKGRYLHCFHECHARAAHSPGAFIVTELLEGHYYPLCVWQNLSSELVHSDSVTCPTLHKFLCHNKALSLGHPRLSIWKNQQFKESSVQTNQLLKTPNSLLNCFLGLPNVYSYHMTPWIKLRMILNKDQVY